MHAPPATTASPWGSLARLPSHVLTLASRNDLQAVCRPGRLQLECFRRVRLKSRIAGRVRQDHRHGLAVYWPHDLVCIGRETRQPSGAALVLRVTAHGGQMPAKANGVRSGSNANQWPDVALTDCRPGIRRLLPRGARR